MNSIFVFGSNLHGRHGAGAARTALRFHGARYGCGEGPQGMAYAIPTKDGALQTLPLDVIKRKVENFIHYAEEHPELQFFVTRIGCGLAEYRNEDIAPFFIGAPGNCKLDNQWEAIINKKEKKNDT